MSEASKIIPSCKARQAIIDANACLSEHEIKRQKEIVRRDIAAMAMQGIISAGVKPSTSNKTIAATAVQMADALLKELEG